MMIAKAQDDEGEMILLGLSRKNIERLMAGDPIRISRKTHGPMAPAGLTIAIIFGETELQMKRMLEEGGLVDENTKTTVDPRLTDEECP